MAQTPSTMPELGMPAPDFSLPDPTSRPPGRIVSLHDFDDAGGLLVAFICNHCPFVKHIREELARLGHWCRERNVAMVAINSNDVENYPDDSPEKMAEEAESTGYTFPYLYDESQETARAYHAACTPDFFLFGPFRDGQRTLVYRGQLDDSRPGNGVPVTGADLRAAITRLLSGEPISPDQKPSIGCNIKWK